VWSAPSAPTGAHHRLKSAARAESRATWETTPVARNGSGDKIRAFRKLDTRRPGAVSYMDRIADREVAAAVSVRSRDRSPRVRSIGLIKVLTETR